MITTFLFSSLLFFYIYLYISSFWALDYWSILPNIMINEYQSLLKLLFPNLYAVQYTPNLTPIYQSL